MICSLHLRFNHTAIVVKEEEIKERSSMEGEWAKIIPSTKNNNSILILEFVLFDLVPGYMSIGQ